MVENIQNIFAKLTAENQTKTVQALCDNFKMRQPDDLKHRWLTLGRIPEYRQHEVLTIVQNAFKKQFDESIKLMEVIDPETVKP